MDETLWIWHARTGIRIYDFDFRGGFPCRCPWERPSDVLAFGRVGAFGDYPETYLHLGSEGIRLVNSPEEHHRASELGGWYRELEDLTPRSRVFDTRPSVADIREEFQFPVFVKGARQTSRHRKALSIIGSSAEFESAMEQYASDSILHWQPIVVREFVELREVEVVPEDRIPSSFEFRTFWFNGQLVGAGRYWWEGRPYDWNDTERADALAVASEAARRVRVPFLVVDVAMTDDGRWIAIECNDGQESGYAGVSPIGMWQRIVDICRAE